MNVSVLIKKKSKDKKLSIGKVINIIYICNLKREII